MALKLIVNNKGNLFTPSELRSVPALLLGKTNEEMGIIDNVSRRTIKDRVEHMMQKMNACNRVHLVTELFKHKYVEFLGITLMMFAIGVTVVADQTDIRSQRGSLRTVRVTRISRIRGRQREQQFTEPGLTLVAAV
jgi:DNA-binding CsgD family transcriptional regulator